MARLALIGLPNVGKTTLFNALTGLTAPTAAHPFSTVEPNIGVARIPDERLERVAALEGSAKVVHATLDLLDLPAMSPGDTSFAAQFIGRLREMDAIAAVLRAFEDDAVADSESGTDSAGQAETLMLELVLADAEVLSRRAEKAAKEATADASKRGAAAAIGRAAAMLAEGKPLREATWDESEVAAFRDFAPVTLKPCVWVVNAGEDEPSPGDLKAAVERVVPDTDVVVVLSAALEEEASLLDPSDRDDLYEGLGLGEGALARMVQAAHTALGLLSFFTVGPKEAHAWTVRDGASAREAAGKIHSDLARGFIRAEVAPIEEVIGAGGWDAAKAAGIVRVEGKEYRVVEGDVMLVRFSV